VSTMACAGVAASLFWRNGWYPASHILGGLPMSCLHRRPKSSRLMSSRIRYFLILILFNVVYQKQTQI
jgi:hypothetical protein